ncbi:MAG: hypothetical protein HZY76_17310 [Anaerolineae bacterium]|nr:MAG: hypothetical protein HZY76_17310 [Anaerolineae bacterium]
MLKLADELMVARVMAAELPDYLLGDRLFRQIVAKTPSGTQQPKMTLGSLLGRYRLLQHFAGIWTPPNTSNCQPSTQPSPRTDESTAQWIDYIQKELKSYLASWRWYIDECIRRGGCASTYSGEVWIRTRLALLVEEAAALNVPVLAEQGQLRRLDSQLRSVWQEGHSCWPTRRAISTRRIVIGGSTVCRPAPSTTAEFTAAPDFLLPNAPPAQVGRL